VCAARCGDDRLQLAVEHDLGGDGDLVEDLASRVVGQDRHGHLVHEVARVGLDRHVMERGAGLVLAADDGPVHRDAAAVLREQGAVHVERAAAGGREQLAAQHVAVVEEKSHCGAAPRTRATTSAAFGSSGVITGIA